MGEGSDLKIGTPFLNSVVSGEVVESGKGKKVVIYKYKAKKDYRKKQGHRQPYTNVKITAIGGSVQTSESDAKSKEASSESVSMSMKKDELIAFAKDHNIDIDEKATKQVIVDKINSEI